MFVSTTDKFQNKFYKNNMVNIEFPVMVKCEYRNQIEKATGKCFAECPYGKKEIALNFDGDDICMTSGYKELSIKIDSPIKVISGLLRRIKAQ